MIKNFLTSRRDCIIGFLFCVSVSSVFLFTKSQTNDHTQLKQPDEISFALFSAPEEFNLGSADVSVNKILFSMQMGFLTQNYKGEFYSGVAKSWQVSPDKLDYIFELNTDLTFHDGRKMTCVDVEYSFFNILSGKINTVLNEIIATTTCLDDHRFQVHLNYPSSLFLPLLTHDASSIIPKGDDSKNARIGIGPYRLKEMTTDYVLFESWNQHPKLKPWSARKIRFKIYKSVPEAIEAFDHHEVDIVDLSGFPASGTENKTSTSFYSNRIWLLTFGDSFGANPSGKISCIHQQMNRQNLAEKLNESTPEIFLPAYGLVRPHSLGYLENEIKPEQEASCFSNSPVHHVIAIEGHVRDELINEIKKNFMTLGMKVDFTFLPKKEFIQRMFDRKYDVSLSAINISHEPEQNFSKIYGSKPLAPFAKSISPELNQEIIDLQSVHSASLRANKIYAFEQKISEDPVVVPLLFQKTSYLIRDCLSAENVTMTSSYEKLQEVGLINGCE